MTLDAIEQRTADGSTRAIDPKVRIASWLNPKQATDTGFFAMDKLEGGVFPGANLDNGVPIDKSLENLKDKDGTGNGRHAKMPLPKAVGDMIEGHLYLKPAEP